MEKPNSIPTPNVLIIDKADFREATKWIAKHIDKFNKGNSINEIADALWDKLQKVASYKIIKEA